MKMIYENRIIVLFYLMVFGFTYYLSYQNIQEMRVLEANNNLIPVYATEIEIGHIY